MMYFVRFSFVNRHNDYRYGEEPNIKKIPYSNIVTDFVLVSLDDEWQIQEDGFFNLIKEEVIRIKKIPKHDGFDIINISELRSLRDIVI